MLMGIEASILVFIMEEEQKSFIMPQHDGWVSLVDWNTKTLEKIIIDNKKVLRFNILTLVF